MFPRISISQVFCGLALLTLSTAMRVAPAEASMFDDFSCGYINSLGCGGGHNVMATGAGVRPTHEGCMICEAGDPSLCHSGCQAMLAPDLKVRYEGLRDAAQRGDVGALVALGAGLGEFVIFNETRSAIQVRDCSRTYIVASLPVDARSARIAMASLPIWHDGFVVATSDGVGTK